MATRASKGAVDAVVAAEVEEALAVRSVVDPPRRSPALVDEEEAADWIWEAAKRLYIYDIIF